MLLPREAIRSPLLRDELRPRHAVRRQWASWACPSLDDESAACQDRFLSPGCGEARVWKGHALVAGCPVRWTDPPNLTVATCCPMQRWLSSLVLAEHSAGSLNASTAQTVAAARCLDGPISVLVAGDDLGGVPEQAAKLEGVSAVLTASDPGLEHLLAAPTAALLVAMQKK